MWINKRGRYPRCRRPRHEDKAAGWVRDVECVKEAQQRGIWWIETNRRARLRKVRLEQAPIKQTSASAYYRLARLACDFGKKSVLYIGAVSKANARRNVVLVIGKSIRDFVIGIDRRGGILVAHSEVHRQIRLRFEVVLAIKVEFLYPVAQEERAVTFRKCSHKPTQEVTVRIFTARC